MLCNEGFSDFVPIVIGVDYLPESRTDQTNTARATEVFPARLLLQLYTFVSVMPNPYHEENTDLTKFKSKGSVYETPEPPAIAHVTSACDGTETRHTCNQDTSAVSCQIRRISVRPIDERRDGANSVLLGMFPQAACEARSSSNEKHDFFLLITLRPI